MFVTNNGYAAIVAGMETFDKSVANTRNKSKFFLKDFTEVLLIVFDEYFCFAGHKIEILHGMLCHKKCGGKDDLLRFMEGVSLVVIGDCAQNVAIGGSTLHLEQHEYNKIVEEREKENKNKVTLLWIKT